MKEKDDCRVRQVPLAIPEVSVNALDKSNWTWGRAALVSGGCRIAQDLVATECAASTLD